MIENIERLSVMAKFEEEQFKLPEEISRKIEKFWNQCKLENPHLWNGEVMCVDKYNRNSNEIVITVKKSNYAHYLYDERIILPQQYSCSNLAAGCLLETSDNYYIVGELSKNHSFPHIMQVSGGNADAKDIKDGNIDLLNTIIRECKEELNIDLQDKKQVEYFETRYICMPTETVHTYILFAKGKLNMTKSQMEEHYGVYLKYLNENNLDIEFEKIHFIKKGNISEQLEKFKNPKRNYLKILLEIDSKAK